MNKKKLLINSHEKKLVVLRSIFTDDLKRERRNEGDRVREKEVVSGGGRPTEILGRKRARNNSKRDTVCERERE